MGRGRGAASARRRPSEAPGDCSAQRCADQCGLYEIGSPKTGKARRLGFASFLGFLLRPLANGKPNDGLLFGNGIFPMPYPNAGDGWFMGAVKRARKADAKFPEITLHDLRHTAASLAVSAGANVKAVQRMLGHASAAMTLDVYAELFDEDMDAVARNLSEARTTALSDASKIA